MKKMLLALVMSSWSGRVAVLLALCSFTPASRADVVVMNNTGSGPSDPTFPTTGDSSATVGYIAEIFTTGSGGTIDNLALQLDIVAGSSANVYITANLTTFTLLGTVSSGTTQNHQNISVNFGANPLYSLSANTIYAIVLEPSGSGVGWDYTSSTATGGDATDGVSYESTDGGVSWSPYVTGASMQLDMLAAVPEVPMTGAVMGFGALAIATGSVFRKKVYAFVSTAA